MNETIDFERSIRTGRLYFKGTPRQKFMIALRNMALGIPSLALSLAFFVAALHSGSPLLIFLASVPVVLISISITLINKLVKVEGTELRRNQTEIIRLLISTYPGVIRHNCSEKVIVITKGHRTSVFDKEIHILLDDTDVYLNISMLGARHFQYVFFAIPNYISARTVLRNFNERVKALPYLTPIRS